MKVLRNLLFIVTCPIWVPIALALWVFVIAPVDAIFYVKDKSDNKS